MNNNRPTHKLNFHQIDNLMRKFYLIDSVELKEKILKEFLFPEDVEQIQKIFPEMEIEKIIYDDSTPSIEELESYEQLRLDEIEEFEINSRFH